MENTNELKYSMDLKNFYRNIMISPKCIELVAMLEVYSELYASLDYSNLDWVNIPDGIKILVYKVYDGISEMVEFIEKKYYIPRELRCYDDDYYARRSLVHMLINMYNDDI